MIRGGCGGALPDIYPEGHCVPMTTHQTVNRHHSPAQSQFHASHHPGTFSDGKCINGNPPDLDPPPVPPPTHNIPRVAPSFCAGPNGTGRGARHSEDGQGGSARGISHSSGVGALVRGGCGRRCSTNRHSEDGQGGSARGISHSSGVGALIRGGCGGALPDIYSDGHCAPIHKQPTRPYASTTSPPSHSSTRRAIQAPFRVGRAHQWQPTRP